MSRVRIALVLLALLVTSVGCDHASKQLARSTLGAAGHYSLAADAVRFELAGNPGAFLGLGERLPEAVRRTLLLGLPPLVFVALCGVALRKPSIHPAELVGLGLVAGGGLANWLDRLLHDGLVTDFVSLGAGVLRTGIFNFADVVIVAGVGLLVCVRFAPSR